MAPTTRRARVEDAPLVALAHTRAWQVAYREVVPADYLDSLDLYQRTELWAQLLNEDVATDYVVEVDDRVVGFANVGPFRGDRNDAALGELWAMYVHPDSWGTGAGYALMQQTIEHFRANNVVTAYLWVFEHNPQARRFYDRQGWSANDATQAEDIGGVQVIERRYSIEVC